MTTLEIVADRFVTGLQTAFHQIDEEVEEVQRLFDELETARQQNGKDSEEFGMAFDAANHYLIEMLDAHR